MLMFMGLLVRRNGIEIYVSSPFGGVMIGMCDALALCIEPITGCKPWKQYRGTAASESPARGALATTVGGGQRKGFF